MKTIEPLVDIIGAEAFYKLCDALGGKYVYIPTSKRAAGTVKSLHGQSPIAVKKFLNEGLSIAAIADKLSVSRVTIYNIIRRENKKCKSIGQ